MKTRIFAWEISVCAGLSGAGGAPVFRRETTKPTGVPPVPLNPRSRSSGCFPKRSDNPSIHPDA
jgi:hypothetical protein